MIASFNKAVVYSVEVTCKSPLRTGGSGGETDAILRRADGTAFLQGASLAGAMREYSGDENLFGSHTHEGCLAVSDLVFNANEAFTRPRVHINEKTGAAENGGYYSVTALPMQTAGNFKLTLRGTGDTTALEEETERCLCAMNGGIITLGAQRSNGYGRVALSVRKRVFDLNEEEDREAWLNNEQPVKVLTLKDAVSDNTCFMVTIKVSNMLVKAAASRKETGDSASEVTAGMMEGDSYVLPGSAIKGVIKAEAARIAGKTGNIQQLQALFGSEESAGHISVSDALLPSNRASGMKISRIRINKFTGGAYPGALFTEEPVSGEIKFGIYIKDCSGAGAMLVLYALRNLALGIHNLGSGNSIGRGKIERLQVAVTAGDKKAEMDVNGGSITLKDKDGLVAAWGQAFSEAKDEQLQ